MKLIRRLQNFWSFESSAFDRFQIFLVQSNYFFCRKRFTDSRIFFKEKLKIFETSSLIYLTCSVFELKYKLYTRVPRNLMCIVAHLITFCPILWMMIPLNSSFQYRSKVINRILQLHLVSNFQSVFHHCCKNGWERFWEHWRTYRI